MMTRLVAVTVVAQSLPADLKTLSSQALIRTYLRLSTDLQESFMTVARGPAKFQVQIR